MIALEVIGIGRASQVSDYGNSQAPGNLIVSDKSGTIWVSARLIRHMLCDYWILHPKNERVPFPQNTPGRKEPSWLELDPEKETRLTVEGCCLGSQRPPSPYDGNRNVKAAWRAIISNLQICVLSTKTSVQPEYFAYCLSPTDGVLARDVSGQTQFKLLIIPTRIRVLISVGSARLPIILTSNVYDDEDYGLWWLDDLSMKNTGDPRSWVDPA
ncbi:hypothetical protein M434DRAFT_11019 [Hypoxylon sp. CO27-5]|nr:hypothetical protein M434DRAFT_11019 [Hypoxylon sp. CO27-5]